ncbi:hypothetical protein HYY73_02255 [Candidatus Woesearchaeota archaeon]|nr:hypothetical protein [Candidatus Woesearchaeota archaeon]
MKKLMFLLALSLALLAIPAVADTGILVEYPDGTADTFCVRTESKLSGYGLLQKSKFSTEWSASSSFGRLLCKVNGIGTDVKGTSCEFNGEFWGFFLKSGSTWEFSPVGLESQGDCWDGRFTSFIGHYCAQGGDLIALKFGDGSKKPKETIFTDVCRQYVQIGKVSATVGSRKKAVSQGATIKDAKPASPLAFEVKVQNGANGPDFDNVELSLVIEGLDIDSVEDIGRLGPGNDDEEMFEEEVPDDAEDGTYPAFIKVTGTDTSGNVHKAEISFSIEVERKRHELKLIEAGTQQEVGCLLPAEVSFTVANYGRSDEKKARINFSTTDSFSGLDFSVDSGSEYFNSARIGLTGQGTKEIRLSVYDSQGKLQDEQVILTSYEGCQEPEPRTTSQAQPVNTNDQTPAQVFQSTPETAAKNDDTEKRMMFMAILTGYGVLLILTAAVIAIMRR